MFDDFGPSPATRAARKRMSGSVAAALLLYGGIGGTLVAATATARIVVEEKLTQIEFAPPPPPPAPPPERPPPPTAATPEPPRPKAKRRELTAPKEVPKAQLAESDKPLVAAGDVGPVDGFLNGVEGGKGSGATPPPAPPPPPKPEPLIAAVAMSGNVAPRYSASARRRGVEGAVVVSFDILENGTVGNVHIDSGPEDLRDSVLSAVTSWRFQPAKRGGKPVRTHKTQSIRFRLDDA